MPTPTLSPEQLQTARKAATEARRARAQLKEQLRSGSLSLGQALDKAACDDVLAHVKVVDLLKALPRVGEKRAGEIMERLGIAPTRRVRGLGRHQVAALKAEFAPSAPRAAAPGGREGEQHWRTPHATD